MSIFQEYEETRDDIGHEMFDTIQKYLDAVSPLENYDKYNEELRQYKDLEGQDYINKMEELKRKHKVVLFSDVIYNYDAWKKYEKWFHEEYKKRKAVITGAWKSGFDDVRYSARIYLDNKYLGNIIDRCDAPEVWEKELDNLYRFKDLVYCYFDKYTNLPKLSECSKLLQEIYKNVATSESSMCHITEDDWKEYYADEFSEKDFLKLKEEVKKYNLEDIITFDEGEYKIVGYGNLEISFIDNRNLNRSRDYER